MKGDFKTSTSVQLCIDWDWDFGGAEIVIVGIPKENKVLPRLKPGGNFLINLINLVYGKLCGNVWKDIHGCNRVYEKQLKGPEEYLPCV